MPGNPYLYRMEQEKIFRTKSGYCHVLPDKIVLTRNGITGSVSNTVAGNGMARVLIIYGLLALVLSYTAYVYLTGGRYVTGGILLLLALLLIWSILASLNNSAVPVIERDRIVKIGFIRGIPGVTRSRFEVFFRNAGNRVKKRLILMPGSLNGEKEENEKALRIMKEEGLI